MAVTAEVCVRDPASSLSDSDLVARLAARDAAAFRLVVERETKTLHRIAFRLLGDSSGAEDVAQEALLRLWKGAGQIVHGTSNVSAWLRKVATNLCFDRLRQRKFSSDEDVPDSADGAPLADAALHASQMRAAVVAALGTVSDRHRAAIILTYYEGLPNAAAAETLDMNVKAFESLLLRARQALRAALTQHGALTVDDVRGVL